MSVPKELLYTEEHEWINDKDDDTRKEEEEEERENR